jgi:hypothetical protein
MYVILAFGTSSCRQIKIISIIYYKRYCQIESVEGNEPGSIFQKNSHCYYSFRLLHGHQQTHLTFNI